MPGGRGGGEAGADHHRHRALPAQPDQGAQCDHSPGRVQCGSPLHSARQAQARHLLEQDPPQVNFVTVAQHQVSLAGGCRETLFILETEYLI